MAATLAVRNIIVADLTESMKFYETVFGFEATDVFEGEDPALDAMTQLTDVHLRSQLMRDKNEVFIELTHFFRPTSFGSRKSNTIPNYGLTHFAFYVDDVDAVRARVLAAGGRALDHTRVKVNTPEVQMDVMFVSDPNGVRIELAAVPGKTSQFLWNGICVRDLEKSIKYYRTLGFEPAETYDLRNPQDWVAKLNEVEVMRLFVQVIRDQHGNALELINMLEPNPVSGDIPRPYTRFGLANLAFFVDDRDAVATELVALGGEMYETARVNISVNGLELKQWHGIDPNGARIELVQRPKIVP